MKNALHDLIAQILGGDTASFRTIVDTYKSRVASISRRFTSNDEDMHDVAQEAFIRMHRALDRYKPSCSFDAWIYRITVNAAKDFLRVKKRHRASPLESVPESTIVYRGASAETQMEMSETMDIIRRTSQELPERQKEVFILRDMEGLSVGETAEILGIEPPTVRVHLSRARERIRKALVASGIDSAQPYDNQRGDDR